MHPIIFVILQTLTNWKNKKQEKYMFDNLSERLERSFKILKGEGKITEIKCGRNVERRTSCIAGMPM